MDYTADYEALLIDDLPTFARGPKHVAWLTSVQYPLTQIYDDFLATKAVLDVEVNYNSETMLFEHILNTLFDATLKRIYIDNYDLAGGVSVVASLQSEGRPKVVAYLQSEGFEALKSNLYSEFATIDFVVYIPAEISGEVAAIQRVVTKFKLGGKTFIIQSI